MDLTLSTRLTTAFSKKLDNLKAALALHFAGHNFVRVHRSLRVTPAMEAGLTERVWDLAEFLPQIRTPPGYLLGLGSAAP